MLLSNSFVSCLCSNPTSKHESCEKRALAKMHLYCVDCVRSKSSLAPSSFMSPLAKIRSLSQSFFRLPQKGGDSLESRVKIKDSLFIHYSASGRHELHRGILVYSCDCYVSNIHVCSPGWFFFHFQVSFCGLDIRKGLLQRIFNHVAGI